MELTKAVKCLRKEKLELAEGLLARLEEKKKAREDVSSCTRHQREGKGDRLALDAAGSRGQREA